jgi:glycosyltransferase involved in cell wall biosynthesis
MKNDTRPLISVVIPTYNRSDTICRAVGSVLSQTYKDWEILIIDNFSVDGSWELIESLASQRIRPFRIRNNGVIAVSRNIGIDNARGDWIAFLDSDDWWKPRKLESCVDQIEKNTDIIYHDLTAVSGTVKKNVLRRYKSRSLVGPAFKDLIANGNALLNSGVIVRKGCLNAIGGIAMDENLVGAEDFDTWLTLAKKGFCFKRVPEELGYYWNGGGNYTNPKRTIRCIYSIMSRHLATAEPAPWWCKYQLAEAYRKCGDPDKSNRYFFESLAAAPNLHCSVRTCAKWILMAIKSK